MSLRNILFVSSIMLLPSITMVAQSVHAEKIDVNTNSYRVSLSHKIKLTDSDIKLMGDKYTAFSLPTIKELKSELNANKSVQAKGRNVSNNVLRTNQLRGAYIAADTLLWESFEGWDGITYDWSPEGWTEYTNVDNSLISEANAYNPTWQTFQTDGYYAPYATDGNYVGIVQYGYDQYSADSSTVIAPAPEQDEWLVSPAVTNIQNTNYLILDLGYAPISMHMFYDEASKEDVVDFERKSFDFEVLVTTDARKASNDESKYDCVFKLSDEIAKEIADIVTVDESSVASLMSFGWHHFAIPLNEYAGKNIRVAMRYKGKNGGTVIVDAIRVSDMLPTPKYSVPGGAFFYGFSQEYYAVGGGATPTVLLPADREQIWNNHSNEDSKNFEWVYSLPTDAEDRTGKSSDKELVMNPTRASNFYLMPKLTAYTGARSDVYDKGGLYRFGGNTAISYEDGTTALYGAGNYDLTKSFWTAPIDGTGQHFLFGTGSELFFGQTDGLTGKVKGVANWYEQPASPYIISTVWLSLAKFTALTNNIQFNCTIYRVKRLDNGIIEVTDEVIANASTTSGAVKNSSVDGNFNMIFNFAVPVVINEPVLIYIDGFQNKNILTIAPVAQALAHDSGKNFALLSLETDNGSYILYDLEGLIQNADGVGGAQTSFCISSNAVYPYLYSVDGYTFEVPSEGGMKEFVCDTYFSPESWTVEGLPEWVKIEQTLDEATGSATVRFVAEALPAGTDGRSANVKITSVCNDITFTILQGTEINAIQGVESGNVAKAYFVGNAIQLYYGKDINSVAVYDMTGKLVKMSNLSASGSASLDATELSRGTYIVRFGGQNHPVVKISK